MIPVLVQIKGLPDFAGSKRALKEITREAHRVQALAWHRLFIARHFDGIAAQRYGYKKRTAKYKKRKERAGKGTVDLIYSGLTREAMLRPPLVRAFPSRARVSMAAPSYVKMRPYKRNAPNLGGEITTVISDEVAILEEILGGEVRRGIERTATNANTITIGSH